MTRLRRVVLVALVWLSAAGTLLAGFPRWECLCVANSPAEEQSGAAKPGCCCCGGECGSGEGCPSCGQGSADEDHLASAVKATTPILKTSPCQRVPVRAEIVAAGDKTGSTPAAIVAHTLTPTNQILLNFVTNQRDSRAIHLLPPPTDLVTVLQHFLI